jgi:uracil-DNA glycosylase family 4
MPNPTEPDPERFDPRFVAAEGRARQPRIYLVGEAPGEAEAKAGRPFVGPAGQKLRKMMRIAGIDPAEVRLGNAIPYRPIAPGKAGARHNRPPTRAEIDRFAPCLLRDIERSRPGAILTLGRSAMAALGIRSSIKRARGHEFDHAGTPVLVTYHPQYATYRGGEDGPVWRAAVHDLKRAWRVGSARASEDRQGR